MRVLLGIVVGILLMWLYHSKRVREEAERRLATAPESLRQAATSAKTISTNQIGRVAQAVDTVPVPQGLRDVIGRATTAVRPTAEEPAETPEENHVAALPVQQGADGA